VPQACRRNSRLALPQFYLANTTNALTSGLTNTTNATSSYKHAGHRNSTRSHRVGRGFRIPSAPLPLLCSRELSPGAFGTPLAAIALDRNPQAASLFIAERAPRRLWKKTPGENVRVWTRGAATRPRGYPPPHPGWRNCQYLLIYERSALVELARPGLRWKSRHSCLTNSSTGYGFSSWPRLLILPRYRMRWRWSARCESCWVASRQSPCRPIMVGRDGAGLFRPMAGCRGSTYDWCRARPRCRWWVSAPVPKAVAT